jgi:hypothetical protein
VLGATRKLEIDSDELAGGWRCLPRFNNDPSIIDGYVEFFLYDTTPGGAGFASAAFDSFDGIIAVTGSILGKCKCRQSCHSCLRTYQNRNWHDQLDRHLAHAMLEYVTTGKAPSTPPQRASQALQRLVSSLQLMEPKLRLSRNLPGAGSIDLELAEKRVQVGIKSCMEEFREAGAGTILLTDYDLLHNLPHVANRVLTVLKNE